MPDERVFPKPSKKDSTVLCRQGTTRTGSTILSRENIIAKAPAISSSQIIKNMKTLFLSLSFLVSSVGAFSPSFGRARSSSSNNVMIRHAQPQSVTEAIQAALDASRKYGATSPEAQVLWDAVEEMNASDNR